MVDRMIPLKALLFGSVSLLTLCGSIRAGQTPSKMEQEFKNPPPSAGLQAYWFWVDSNFSKEGITKDLEAMKSAGFSGALILNAGLGPDHQPWPDQTYRSGKYFDAIRHAAAEADRLGMTIGLANAPGYDGTGGPWVPEKDSMRRLVWALKECEGPQKLDVILPNPIKSQSHPSATEKAKKPTLYDDIAVLAVPAGQTIATNQVVDISAHMKPDSRLVWDVPSGKWSVYRLGYAPTMVGPHPVPNGVTGSLEVDKMDKEANLRHWRNVIDPLKKSLGPLYGKSFNRLHIDSYECGTQNWSPRFREEFLNLKGYDPVPWIVGFGTPALGYKPGQYNGDIMSGMPRGTNSRIIGDADMSARFDRDYADVINRLFTDNWILARSLMTPDKIKLSFEPYSGPFSTIEAAAIADIPMGTFWTTTSCSYSIETMNGQGKWDPQTASAARAAGKTVINSESFTSMPQVCMWTEKPALLKYIADGAFCGGVNQMTLHQWTLQPFDDQYQPGMTFWKWGLHFGRFQTWFEPGKAFFNYLERCQAMLQQGEEVVDTLAIDAPLLKTEHCDMISSRDFLSDDTKVVGGKVRLSSGRTYEYLTYPATGMILPEVAEKLKRLVDQGATLVTARFRKSPSLKDYPSCDQRIEGISKEIWDSGDYKGRVFSDADSAAAKLGLKPDFVIQSENGPQSSEVVHRRSPEADVYFVANRLDKPQNLTIDFRIQGRQPELWQAEDTSIHDAPVWNERGGVTSVPLSLGGHQTVFVVFRRPADQSDHPVSLEVADNSAPWSVGHDRDGKPSFRSPAHLSAKVVYSSGKQRTIGTEPIPSMTIDGSWDVSFRPKLGDPFALVFPELVDFSKHADQRVNHFSGTAVYRKTLRLDSSQLASNHRILLDLGTMNDIAKVKVNDHEGRVLWYAPYVMDVTGLLHPGENHLEIEVTNTWANALIGDEQIPADFETPREFDWKKNPYGYQIPKFPDWFLKNQPRPSKRKTFTTWNYYNKESKLQPAGLVGPVQLHYEETKGF
jgi:hypothetical protein